MQTTVRMPIELHQKLKKKAKERGMTLNGFVVSILWEKVDKKASILKATTRDTRVDGGDNI